MSTELDNAPPPPRRRFGPVAVLTLALLGLAVGVVAGPSLRRTAAAIADRLHAADRAHDDRWFTCGMHPQVIQRGPGDCPICHMPLTPLDPARLDRALHIDPEIVQQIGVKIAPVTRGPLALPLRSVATIEPDERRVRDHTVRTDGLVVKLYANSVGAPVKAGDVLADFHSPDAVADAAELAAVAPTNDPALIQAARQKLQLLGVPDDFIEHIQTAREVPWTFPIRSTITGVVQTMGGHEGHWLTKGQHLNEVADLSRVWALVPIYENQLARVRVGQSAALTLAALPGRRFTGRVVYIYPTLDTATRQARVRLEFDNPDGLLMPGMFGEAQITDDDTDARRCILVPRSAVIDTGKRRIAFVSLGGGRFEPRELKLGADAADDRVQVLQGLAEGEQVVVSGQFLLDSETRLREALLDMVRGSTPADPKPAAPQHALSDAAAAPLADALRAYLGIGDRLAADALADRAAAAEIERAIQRILTGSDHDAADHAAELREISRRAAELADAPDLKSARRIYGQLSEPLDRLLQKTGVPPQLGAPLFRFVCGMYGDAPQNGLWVQFGEKPRNPYMGSKMVTCKSDLAPLPVAAPRHHP